MNKMWACASRLWLLILLCALAKVCLAVDQSEESSIQQQEQPQIEWPAAVAAFGRIRVIRLEELTAPSWDLSLADSVVSWCNRAVQTVSDGFWSLVSSLHRFSQTRHRFYSNILDQIVPAGSPLRFRTNFGATEPLPAIIPEPPTISSKLGLRRKMLFIWLEVVQEYRATAVEAPDGASCHDVVNMQANVLRNMLKSRLETTLCGSDSSRGSCTQKFCNFLSMDSDAAIDTFLLKVGVKKADHLVLEHVSKSLGCPWKSHHSHHSQHLGEISRGIQVPGGEPYQRTESSLMDMFRKIRAGPVARPRPAFYYRRAMIFHNAGDQQISLEFFVFGNGGEAQADARGNAVANIHSHPLLPQVFFKPEGTEEQQDPPMIKMATGRHGAAAL